MNQSVINAAKHHLRKADTIMAVLVQKHEPYTLSNLAKKSPPYLHVLIQAIINQQLSVKAAATITKRLQNAQGGRSFNADKLFKLDDDTMHGCGVSRNKIRYIKSVAEAVIKGELNFRQLVKRDDNTVRKTLTQLPGIGDWSADLFLMNALQRPDVLPLGDLVLRKSMQRHYSLASECGYDDYLRIAEPWRPYRSVASRYLWAAS